MEALNFPAYPAQVKTVSGKTVIFDLIRKKYVALTPEEWVRQHLIHYLTTEKQCPSGLISVETSLRFARLNKRSDLIVNDRNGQALLLAECKAPDVAISTKTFEQIAVYNQTIKAPFLLLTNGMQH
ncbi:MAG: type I restriction enzyme HsdR N-terminal domain-containing protein, partial [Bacteroidales bacterium]|nr:type I restriction enzyme HsdR N-terminal domain-containing protein [Bacteroidales bacterium]